MNDILSSLSKSSIPSNVLIYIPLAPSPTIDAIITHRDTQLPNQRLVIHDIFQVHQDRSTALAAEAMRMRFAPEVVILELVLAFYEFHVLTKRVH
jgi:hypothetical protein